MNRALAWLTENIRMVIAVVAGIVVVGIIGITTESTGAVSFAGLVVGILVGGLIAAESRRRDGR